ncbi:hypothetical protein LCGC14_1706940 [marine sediment metagenome]|uniref:Uncharacterized protein n=1 Tax=marine sediment metagenome TaxID=412755 RepID=A0A0F9HFW4_9ZZZZ
MKEIRYENYRVVIDPYISRWDNSPEKTCSQIIADIKRHIDGYDQVYMESDRIEYCAYCDRDWDADEEGRPECCITAQLEFLETQRIGFCPLCYEEVQFGDGCICKRYQQVFGNEPMGPFPYIGNFQVYVNSHWPIKEQEQS